MPALMQELHALVPSHANAFFWADKNLQISNLYHPWPNAPAIALYLSEFLNRRECEVVTGFAERLSHGRKISTLHQLLKVSKAQFYRHDYYNLVLRELETYDFIRMTVREEDRVLGEVLLHRAPGEAAFTAQDETCLATLAPFLAHALSAPAGLPCPLMDSDDSGLLIVDLNGKPQHVSRRARHLLYFATHPTISPRTVCGGNLALPAGVIQLCRNLTKVFASDERASPPMWVHRNAWGSFCFRAYWLNDSDPEAAPLIGISVTHQEPLPLKLARQMEKLSLSPRQMQVCLSMVGGHTYRVIAKRMDVSERTVINHAQEVYAKLNVHNRSELVNMLMLL